MGSFYGHALPGSFFIAFALWWIFSAFCRYYRCLRRDSRYTSSLTFPCPCICGRFKNWPIEAWIKVIMVAIGTVGELIAGFRNAHERGDEFMDMGNVQHATMFIYFGFSGVADLLTHYKVTLPPKTDYIVIVMALMIEGILFRFHLHGRSDLDVHVHTLLIYAIVANIVAVVVEIRYQHSIVATLGRAYFLLLQGTWFWQLGFILYNPSPGAAPWKSDDHDNMLLSTLLFVWHSFADLLVVLIIGAVIKRFGSKWDTYDNVQAEEYLLVEANDQTVVRLTGDSDSDVEFKNSASTGQNSNP